MERFAVHRSATVPRALLLLVFTATAGLATNYPDTVAMVSKAPPDTLSMGVEAAPIEFVRLLPGILRPVSVAVAPDGRIVVTDSTTPLAKAFVPGGDDVVLEPAAPGTKGPATAPLGVAVDEAGDIYVSDALRREVLVYRSGDLQPSPFAEAEWEGRQPGVLFARGGRLYVADIQNHQILVIDVEREALTAVIGAGQGDGPSELRYPNGVWVSPDGVVYVSDTNNDRIVRFDTEGSALPAWQGPFRNPRGLAGDGNGQIFVANTLAHEILVLDKSGEVVSRIVRAGSREIGFPTGLAIAGDRLFVTDRDAHGVFEWRLTEERRGP